jgi:hypothetical protein
LRADNNEYEIHMMWIPLHVGVWGNKRADQLASDAVEHGIELHARVRPSDFVPLAGMVVIWEDMFTLIGVWFHLCYGLGALTATESSYP